MAATKAKSPAATTAAPAREVRTTRTNVALLVLGAVGVFLWMAWFSAWKMGLWAAVPFAVAFLDRLTARLPKVGEDVSKALARGLASRVTTAVLGVLLLAAVAVSQLYGTVEVVSAEPRTAAPRRVELRQDGEAPRPTALGGEERVRWTLHTSWSHPATATVFTEQQEVEVEVPPWHRRRVRLADTFAQPVLLVLPTLRLMDFTVAGGATVEVVRGADVWEHDYAGEALLIGCGPREICLPGPQERQAMEASLAQRPGRRYRQRYVHPVRLPFTALAPGDEVRVTVRVGDAPLAQDGFAVEAAADLQVEELDALP